MNKSYRSCIQSTALLQREAGKKRSPFCPCLQLGRYSRVQQRASNHDSRSLKKLELKKGWKMPSSHLKTKLFKMYVSYPKGTLKGNKCSVEVSPYDENFRNWKALPF